MTKLWLVIKDCDTKRVWTKYFENELEMNNYKNKIRFVKHLLLIEDSRDIECYFIDLFGRETPVLINRDMPEHIEFQIMTQQDYERQEKDILYKKFDKMFFD